MKHIRYLIYGILTGLFVGLCIHAAHARDSGQWDEVDNPPEVRNWYRNLMRPDMPNASCCGLADAYWCDGIIIKDSHTFCTITDTRDDRPLARPHIDIGTVIPIPDEKLKWDKGNPTGHAVVFLGGGGNLFGPKSWFVFCFVQNGGT